MSSKIKRWAIFAAFVLVAAFVWTRYASRLA